VNGFLLDTNVISELIRPRPDPRVPKWVNSTDADLLFLSVLSLGEIRKGIAAMTDAIRKTRLETWTNRVLIPNFEDRILPVDQAIAERWGEITGTLALRGAPLPVIDGLLAATALQHNLTVVTRNTRHVQLTGASVLDPWQT